MAAVRDLGPAFHVIAGIVVGGLAIFGVAREMLQHDASLTLWQWGEALSFPAGGMLALVLGSLILSRLKQRKE